MGARIGTPLVLVTRPQEGGRDLAAQLRARGRDALWWPAFDLLPPEEPQLLREHAARLASFDLLVFVSVPAVERFAAALRAVHAHGPWPQLTAIAAVGAATGSAARAQLPGASGARLICPQGTVAAEGGSEALWAALQEQGIAPRQVLIVRAQRGREWLAQRFAATGASVTQLVAYRREVHRPTAQSWGAVRAVTGAGARLALLFSSTEAIDAIADQDWAGAQLQCWRDQAIALCVHARIGERAQAAGYIDVRHCDARADSVEAALAAPTAA